MAGIALAESSGDIKVRVEAARKIQFDRFGRSKTNNEMSLIEIKEYCKLGESEQELLKGAMKRYNFSGRSLHRILKVSRTIADLDAQPNITLKHLAEAIQYRPKSE
jgi:magnesium chelatase family protein